MKNLGLLIVSVLIATSVFGQISITSAGYPIGSEYDCSSDLTFTDDGGAGSNYSANFNDTITLCPQLECTSTLPGVIGGTKMTVVLLNDPGGSGLIWDVDASDTLYIYDGPDANSPLLAAMNSDNYPIGQQFTASESNPSGCLTLVFITDGATESAGWEAMVSCGFQPQSFEPHIEAFVNGVGDNALNPLDTGFVDVCFGDSILFVAKPLFPYSCESVGYGYEQNVDNVTYEWEITDGTSYAGNDSIWFTPPARFGYLVDLKITDMFPQALRTVCKVRVSQLPSFAGTGPEEDTVCLGQSTNLIGGTTVTDTVGVDIPEGFFQLGGSFAGLTYLPDGSGAQYQAPIEISGFPDGATITNSQDLNQVCITMEHSYTGDLEMALECPNGTQVTLLNSYGAGFIPGGTSGGSIFMGDPIDDFSGGGPGEGWEYCFSSVFNDWGDWPTEYGNNNFVPANNFGGGGNSLNPNGVFLPEEDFSAFAGCPVNGTWTIIVQDNIGNDDGYIFEWGLYFDPSYFPGLGGYQNYIVDEYWNNDPTIVSGMDDTVLVVQPNVPGDYTYTYNVVDDFGCVYDTVVSLYVNPLPSIFNDTVACDLTFQVTDLESNQSGVWFSDATQITFDNAATSTNANPSIASSDAGIYLVSFVDDACQDTVSANIDFAHYPEIFSDTAMCQLTYAIPEDSIISYGGGYWTVDSGPAGSSFSPNEGVLAPTFTGATSGDYYLVFTDSICNNSTSPVLVSLASQPTLTSPIFSCDYSELDIDLEFGIYDANDGIWSVEENPATPFLEDTVVEFLVANGEIEFYTTQLNTTYTVTFTPNNSTCEATSTDLYFPPPVWTGVDDTTLCYGVVFDLYAFDSPTANNYTWNTGESGTMIQVAQEGDYIVTATNECYEYSDTATIIYYLCDIEAPNVVVLSSDAGNHIFYVNSDGIAEFECVILNRWGNEIYTYNDVNGHWDGRDKQGDLMEEGTYFYRIKAKAFGGEELDKHGFIQLFH